MSELKTIKTITINGQNYPFLYRVGTSDEEVLTQVVQKQEYALSKLTRYEEIMQFVAKLKADNKYPLVIDCGSNIGTSVAYFHATIPGARIIAIEPELSNFNLLVENGRGKAAEFYKAAIASEHKALRLSNPNLGHWGYRTSSDGEGEEVLTLTIPDLLRVQMKDTYYPFLVKVDIEGAEKELFSANTEWINKIPILIVELHDWMLPKQEVSAPFLKCITSMPRDFLYYGESIFSIAHNLEGCLV